MPCVSILEAAFAGNGWHVSVSSITKRFSLAERGPADWSVLSQVRERLDRELPWILFTHFGVAQAVLEEGLSSTPGKHIIWQGCVIFFFLFFCGSGDDEPGEYVAFASRQEKHPSPRRTYVIPWCAVEPVRSSIPRFSVVGSNSSVMD